MREEETLACGCIYHSEISLFNAAALKCANTAAALGNLILLFFINKK